jgi:hypothetical protein
MLISTDAISSIDLESLANTKKKEKRKRINDVGHLVSYFVTYGYSIQYSYLTQVVFEN